MEDLSELEAVQGVEHLSEVEAVQEVEHLSEVEALQEVAVEASEAEEEDRLFSYSRISLILLVPFVLSMTIVFPDSSQFSILWFNQWSKKNCIYLMSFH